MFHVLNFLRMYKKIMQFQKNIDIIWDCLGPIVNKKNINIIWDCLGPIVNIKLVNIEYALRISSIFSSVQLLMQRQQMAEEVYQLGKNSCPATPCKYTA